MENIKSSYDFVKKEINNMFHNTRVWLETIDNEYFVMVDSREVYVSDSYESLILRLEMDYLWPKGMHDLHFSYEEPAFKYEQKFSFNNAYACGMFNLNPALANVFNYLPIDTENFASSQKLYKSDETKQPLEYGSRLLAA